MSLNKLLKDLANEDAPLKYSELLQFSGLTSEELADFTPEWVCIAADRKHEILSKLTDISENNLEFDFSSVFRVSLGDADENVREKATLGLWESDDRTIIRPLIYMLNEDPSAGVRAAASLASSAQVKATSMASDFLSAYSTSASARAEPQSKHQLTGLSPLNT